MLSSALKVSQISWAYLNLTAVATAAVREAKAGLDFCQEVYENTEQKIWIVAELEEARLSAQGVILGWPGSYDLVCDLGGSSLELAEINNGEVGQSLTSHLGTFMLKGIEGGSAVREDLVKTTMKKLSIEMGPQQNQVFLVGGAWRALARVDMMRVNYPPLVLHEFR